MRVPILYKACQGFLNAGASVLTTISNELCTEQNLYNPTSAMFECAVLSAQSHWFCHLWLTHQDILSYLRLQVDPSGSSGIFSFQSSLVIRLHETSCAPDSQYLQIRGVAILRGKAKPGETFTYIYKVDTFPFLSCLIIPFSLDIDPAFVSSLRLYVTLYVAGPGAYSF